MYTIFKDDSSIILTDNLKYCDDIYFFYFNKINLKDLLNKIENNTLHIILYDADIEMMWNKFLKNFKVIEAAGGVVQNEENAVLFIFRNEKWDLPKGKVEKDESIQETALREVEEECGVFDLKLGDFITKTYHIYQYKKQQILKISHWYKMKSCTKSLKPQIEEDITEVVWKNDDQIQLALRNTYPNIKLLLKSL
ncbi:MAG: NUDIX domain-containing protein [Flavobacteriaceae bacterium]|nr:NUDIX domain-containing protein [Flavobacteriaceae bacterium]